MVRLHKFHSYLLFYAFLRILMIISSIRFPVPMFFFFFFELLKRSEPNLKGWLQIFKLKRDPAVSASFQNTPSLLGTTDTNTTDFSTPVLTGLALDLFSLLLPINILFTGKMCFYFYRQNYRYKASQTVLYKCFIGHKSSSFFSVLFFWNLRVRK